MKAIVISRSNNVLVKPKNWDDQSMGRCFDLHTRGTIQQGVPQSESAWLPTEAELAALNRGMPIILTILGRQHPPVMVSVGNSDDLQSEKDMSKLNQLIEDIIPEGRKPS